ncbi:MAG TPA: DUF2085 domain-containing protein [Pyrinomonadaceae bacterium]
MPMHLPPTEYVTQLVSTTRRPFLSWLAVSVGAVFFTALVVAAPLAAAGHYDQFALTIYQAFGFLCHQLPERSFFILGNKFAVCSRCTGLYLGFVVTLALYPLLKSLRRTDLPARKWLIAASVPLLIDFSVTFLGVWENTHATRFLTGMLLGSVMVFYVMPGIVELSLRSWSALERAVPRT